MTGRPPHRSMMTPTPTAPFGSLAETIELARYHTAGLGRNLGAPYRQQCLAALDDHRQVLSAITVIPGLRGFVRVSDQPWQVLWTHVAKAINQPLEIHSTESDRKRKIRSLKDTPPCEK